MVVEVETLLQSNLVHPGLLLGKLLLPEVLPHFVVVLLFHPLESTAILVVVVIAHFGLHAVVDIHLRVLVGEFGWGHHPFSLEVFPLLHLVDSLCPVQLNLVHC